MRSGINKTKQKLTVSCSRQPELYPARLCLLGLPMAGHPYHTSISPPTVSSVRLPLGPRPHPFLDFLRERIEMIAVAWRYAEGQHRNDRGIVVLTAYVANGQRALWEVVG